METICPPDDTELAVTEVPGLGERVVQQTIRLDELEHYNEGKMIPPSFVFKTSDLTPAIVTQLSVRKYGSNQTQSCTVLDEVRP